MINPLQCFLGTKGHVALDRSPGHDTLLLRLTTDLDQSVPHTTWSLETVGLHRYTNACLPSKEAVCTNDDGLWHEHATNHEADLLTIKPSQQGLSFIIKWGIRISSNI